MRNPVKTAKRQLLRVGSCALSALMVLGSIPAAAIGDGVTATYDEAYYAMTDYYGNLTDGSVVKSYRTNGIATLTDYGDYDEIINLTDGTVPARNGGMTTFRLDEKALPGTFYFEGKTTKPFQQLPWTISMSYTLNGVPTKAEDLAGQAGVVEIRLDIVPNGQASEYARNNYTLEAMAIFNQDDILSLEAPGAQVQLIGNLRAVLFLGLPGEECHYTIRVGSEDFAFGGMTFLMVPATLSQLEEIAKLSERKDDLEDNYNKLSGSIDSLLDAMTAMTGSLNASANGLEQLNKARGIFSDGKGVIYSGTDALREDLSNLADVLEPVEGQIEALSKTISDSKSVLNSISNTSSDLRAELVDLEDALSALESGSGDVKSVLRAAGSLQSSLNSLSAALGKTPQPPINTGLKGDEGTQFNLKMSQVKTLHNAYEASDLTSFVQYMLMADGMGSTEAKDLATLLTYTGTDPAIIAKREGLLAAKPELAAQATALSKLYSAKSSMSFRDFCCQVFINSSDENIKKNASSLAAQADNLWTLYAAGEPTSTEVVTHEDSFVAEASLVHNDDENSSPIGDSGSSDGNESGSSGGEGGSSADSNGGSGSSSSSGGESGNPSGGADRNPSETGGDAGDEGENPGGGTDGNTPGTGDGESPDGEAGAEGAPTPKPEETKPNDAVVDLISDGLNKASTSILGIQTQLNNTMSSLAGPTGNVVNDLALLCGRLSGLTSLINDAEDTAAAVRRASRELRDILKDAEELESLLDEYEPTLQETLATVSSLSTSAIKTIRDTQGLISDAEALMKSTGATLDDGTKQTLEGLAAVLRSTAKTMGTAGQIKDAKTSICDIIEDTWDEYTGDVNNLLLMDATAEAVSLTDSRNPSPESIQILIRTQEITMLDEDEREAEAAAEVQTTFWGRVAQMFKDFWATITGLFGGKD